MKRTGMLVAVASAVFAVGVPDWKGTLHAETGAYGEVAYRISGASFVQKLKVAGCKTLTSSASTNVEMYDDGTYYYSLADGTPVRGNWALASGVFYLTVSESTLGNVFDSYNAAATAQCKPKYLSLTGVEIIEPSAIISKNYIKVAANNNGTGMYMMKGKQVNDMKAPDSVGNFSVKVKITGVVEDLSRPN